MKDSTWGLLDHAEWHENETKKCKFKRIRESDSTWSTEAVGDQLSTFSSADIGTSHHLDGREKNSISTDQKLDIELYSPTNSFATLASESSSSTETFGPPTPSEGTMRFPTFEPWYALFPSLTH